MIASEQMHLDFQDKDICRPESSSATGVYVASKVDRHIAIVDRVYCTVTSLTIVKLFTVLYHKPDCIEIIYYIVP